MRAILAFRNSKMTRLGLPLSLVFPVGFVALFVLYLYTSRFVTNSSDNAGIILEAQAMAHGNLILHGWHLPPDSFITTEMPLDAVLSAFFRGAQLFRITPALLSAATVTGAAYLASMLATSPATRWLAAGACVALLAFPVGVLFSLAMIAFVHYGTIVAILIAWWAFASFVRGSASYVWLGAFVVVTGLAIAGDPMAELMLVAPAGVVCAWVLWRTRGQDRTARLLLGGAVAALLLGIGIRQALIAAGTHIGSTSLEVASPDRILTHLEWLWIALSTLFHIDVSNGLVAYQRLIFGLINAVFLVVGIVGFARLFRRTLLPSNMRDSFAGALSWSIIGDIFAFVLSDFAQDLLGVRYLLPAFVAAGVLCASAIAEVISSRYLAGFVTVFLAASVLTSGVALAQRSPSPVPEQPLIAFLARHGMTTGLGSYWSADITTLRSGGAIHLSPIKSEGGHISPYRWHDTDDWFAPAQLDAATFIVDDGRTPIAPFQSAVIATFGAPDHIYTVGRYTVFAWDHPFITPATNLG